MTERKMRYVWMIEDPPTGSNAKARWTRIGVAFENRDGSWALDLSAVPVRGGRLQLREPQTAPDGDRQEAAAA